MDGLRWLLLLFGLLVISGVYIYSRRERTKAIDQDSTRDGRGPSLPENAGGPQIGSEPNKTTPDGDVENAVVEQKKLTLRVGACSKGSFAG